MWNLSTCSRINNHPSCFYLSCVKACLKSMLVYTTASSGCSLPVLPLQLAGGGCGGSGWAVRKLIWVKIIFFHCNLGEVFGLVHVYFHNFNWKGGTGVGVRERRWVLLKPLHLLKELNMELSLEKWTLLGISQCLVIWRHYNIDFFVFLCALICHFSPKVCGKGFVSW